jgi:hypothetical protein
MKKPIQKKNRFLSRRTNFDFDRSLDSRRIAEHAQKAARNACFWIDAHRENLPLLG